jgi:putative ABC transport system permease protein
MLRYYTWLAIRSLRRDIALAALIVAAVGIGVGTSMTTYTLFRAMSADPVPGKSAQLFVPQIDNIKPEDLDNGEPPAQLTYRDASALMGAHAAPRQTAMYQTGFIALPPDPNFAPIDTMGRAVYSDFFAMFGAPFQWGTAWGAADDEAHANVVVLGATLNEQLFRGQNSVGHTVTLDGNDYRVVGVLKPWDPRPRVYDVISSNEFADTEDVFLPFTTAIERHSAPHGSRNCNKNPAPGWQGVLDSECVWIQFWAELPAAKDVIAYRDFLNHYAAEQQRIGRFAWPPLTRLRDARQWLVYRKVVPDEVRLTVILALGFLLVCLVNAIGLLLAKFSGRAGELSVRRALGARRYDLFWQCLVETTAIGSLGGLLGLGLTALGLLAERAILPLEVQRLATLDPKMMLITLAAAILATIATGLYPTWRASRVQPAWQLKAQ